MIETTIGSYHLEGFLSTRKGEALITVTGDGTEAKIALSANTLCPLADTLHFGLKPGHLIVWHDGEWLLQDPGYLNYFRPEASAEESAAFSTLTRQRLLSKGWLRWSLEEDRLTLHTFSLSPMHWRSVTLEDDDGLVLDVRDRFVGRGTIRWTFEEPEDETAWFSTHRRLRL